ncbi:MAG: hypothetical protein P8X74_16185 [Reinekea sp.]
MGASAIFGKQIGIKLLHPGSTLESRIQIQPIGQPTSAHENRQYSQYVHTPYFFQKQHLLTQVSEFKLTQKISVNPYFQA